MSGYATVSLNRNTDRRDGTYYISLTDYGTIATGLSLENGRSMLRALSRARYLDATGTDDEGYPTIVALNQEGA